jgi:hypothetical protein
LSSLTLAHPLAALAGLAGLVPLAVALRRLADGRRVRRALGLPTPPRRALLVRPVALVFVFALLGLAAARPTFQHQRERTTRTDVQIVVALDSSRSMLAAAAAGGAERWQRAAAFARRLQAELPGVPIGLSSLTNRLLPYLFPTSDERAYDLVLGAAYGVERPPPALTLDKWVTVFDPLNEAVTRRFFSPRVQKRILVVLSDAEAHAFDARALLRRLERAGTTPVVVRFWQPGERIFERGSASYRATQPHALDALRRAGWPAFAESQTGAALRFIRGAVGSGPRARVGYARDDTQLAPFLGLAALAPLLVLLVPGGHLARGRRLVRRPRSRIAPTSDAA